MFEKQKQRKICRNENDWIPCTLVNERNLTRKEAPSMQNEKKIFVYFEKKFHHLCLFENCVVLQVRIGDIFDFARCVMTSCDVMTCDVIRWFHSNLSKSKIRNFRKFGNSVEIEETGTCNFVSKVTV